MKNPEQGGTGPVSNGMFNGQQRSRILLLALMILFMLGTAVRVLFVDSPGIVPDRQHRSMLITRAFFFADNFDIPEWRRNIAVSAGERQEALEPEILEYLVAMTYCIIGEENPRVYRLISSLFWLLGALPLFLLAVRLSSIDGALVAVAYYLLVPLGVLLNVSLLPESLMIMVFLIGVHLIVRDQDHPTNRNLLLAAAMSGLAILIKPLVVFTLLSAFAIPTLLTDKQGGLGKRFHRFSIFLLVSCAPAAVYYGYGILLADYLRWKIDSSFLPHFFLSVTFWKGWLFSATNAVGWAPLIIALIGFPLLNKGLPRRLVAGLWVGYLVFCLSFNYFVYFLPYYHAQLIVVVALSAAVVAELLLFRLANVRPRWIGPAALLAALLLAFFLSVKSVREGEVYPRFEDREVAAEIGRVVNHSDRVVHLSFIYGTPLEYYGEITGDHWPRPLRNWPLRRAGEQPFNIADRIARLGFTPEYFVITNFRDYQRNHQDLKLFLEKHCPLVAETPNYRIYAYAGEDTGTE